MYIDDAEIKALIKAYQLSRDPDTFHAIRERLSSYVYHYPRKVFRVDHDAACDFYVDVLERLDRMLLRYEAGEYKFLTWFTVTLRNAYLDRVRKQSRWDGEDPAVASYTVAENADLRDTTRARELDAVARKIDREIEGAFVLRDAALFRTHYLEIFKALALESIRVYFDVDYARANEIYDAARETYLPRYAEAMRLSDYLTAIERKIRVFESSRPEKIPALKKTREKYRSRLAALTFTVPYKHLAALFSTTENAATKVVKKIKVFLNERALFGDDI